MYLTYSHSRSFKFDTCGTIFTTWFRNLELVLSSKVENSERERERERERRSKQQDHKIWNRRLPLWPLTNCILLITRKSFRYCLRNSVYAEYTIVNTFTFKVPSALPVFSFPLSPPPPSATPSAPSSGYFRLHLSGTQIKTLERLTDGGEIVRTNTQERFSARTPLFQLNLSLFLSLSLSLSRVCAIMICNFHGNRPLSTFALSS